MVFTKIKEDQFSREVLETSQPVLLEFSYNYCSACQEVKDFLATAIDNDNLKLLELDISASKKISLKYDVNQAPTLLLFQNGKLVAKHIGYIDQHELSELLNHLSLWSRVKEKIKKIIIN
ncbi:hypothetical protein JCM16358_01250 [Halanaerocella petrolearia]